MDRKETESGMGGRLSDEQRDVRREEKRWVEAAADGDARAFRKLYEANVDRVFRLAFRMTGEEDLARDCTQETFIRAYRKLGQFRGDAAFSTWLHTIATSVTLNGIRKRDRHRDRERELDAAIPIRARRGAPNPQVGLRDRLEKAVDALPEIYRTVFLMHDLEGYKHEEIAESLEVAVGTSKARLHRARAKLRESLSDWIEEAAI